MRAFRSSWTCLILAGMIVVAGQGLISAQSYSVRNLGVQLGHAGSSAYGINNKGTVTGVTNNAAKTQFRGFVIEPPYLQMTTIEPLDSLPGASCYAISNQGVVVGYSVNGPVTRLMIWSGGVTSRVPHLTANEAGYLWDINDTGQVVGSSYNRGLLYMNGSNITLNPLVGDDLCAAYGINAGGVIVGASGNTSTFAQHAVKWIQGAPQEVANLGGNQAQANDIADNGVIAGWSRLPGSSASHAYLVLANNSPLGLGVLPGDTFSEALATNGTEAVGFSSYAGEYRAIVYRNGQLHDLNDLIPAGSGWALQIARDINAAGQICGLGLFNGQNRAFLLTPNDGSGGAADWDFTIDEQGWSAVADIPPFEPAEAQHVPGIGYGVRATGYPSFAFLQSPEMTLQAGRTYRLFCTIATTATNADAAPQIRLRALQTTTNMSELLALDSMAGSMPSLSSRGYEYTITTQLNGPAQTYRFYLDYTFFNPFDEQDAWVYLQRVLLVED